MSEVRDKMAEKSPILVLPDKVRVEQLEKKLEAYKGILDPWCPPELQMDTIYKITVLERLLRDGEVNAWELCLEMIDTYGSGLDVYKFNVACGVIDNYCKTGGKGNTGGTGLPGASNSDA